MQTVIATEVKNVVSRLSSEQCKPSRAGGNATAQLSGDAMDRLWMRMQARYGHRWSSAYGDAPDGAAGREWRDTLAGITLDQVANGIKRDAERGDDWPPSSAKFRALCTGKANDGEPGHGANWQAYQPWKRSRALESDEQKAAARKAADKALAEMTAMLGMSA